METTLEETLCAKCAKAGRIAMCYGCQQSFCSRHFIKHRLLLSQQMDDLHKKYEVFQQDLDQDNFEQPLLSIIYAWERKSITKIQEIAEKARDDLQQWMEKTKNEVNISLEQITSEFKSNEKSDNFTEIDLERWTKQLSELRNLLEKSSTISIVEDKKSSSSVCGIKIIEELSSSVPILQTNGCTSQKLIKSIQEHFISMFGPCKLSEENSVVTHSSYRAGLSQISGNNYYSSGKHSIDFLIEQKGSKNIFIGINSASKQKSSSTFDYSVYGWWNLDYFIINGESEGGDNNEIIQTGDKITFIIDCDNQQIQLEHHRTKRLVHLPIKLELCPFPWKILVRLLTTGDSVRILKYVHNK
jgi:hypothetical protein